jgi:GNAT superfamily N-acetyltransferase
MSTSVSPIPANARLIRLTSEHIIKPFNCGDSDLNTFLYQEAKDYLKCLMYVTYILETPDKTIAFYCVSNDLLRLSMASHREFKSKLRKNASANVRYTLFEWNEFPAVKIGRFAVDEDYQGQKIGTSLLDAIIYSFTTNNKTGCTFITVNAINNKRTTKFYIKNGFTFLTQSDTNKESRQMYKCLL